MIMDRLYVYGMTTTSGGNLSIRDSEGVVWISPSGVDKGNLRREDIMKIHPDGSFEGAHRPSVEYPFHLSIYEVRPDVSAVLHAHPTALVAFSLVRKIPDTTLIPQTGTLCGNIGMAAYAVPGSETLGNNIAECFCGGSNIVMLENHGVVVGAESLLTAFMTFEMLEFCAQIEVNSHSLSDKIAHLSEKHMALYKLRSSPMMDEYVHSSPTSEELEVRREMCALIKRAYDKRLFTSGQGTLSKKLSDGSFVITPYKMDRKYLEPEDLVRIDKVNFKRENGKHPSSSVLLHSKIYASAPDIHSVMIAQPPHAMAFAVTDTDFNTHLIPESYAMLKNVLKFPFGSSFMQPELLAKELSIKNPVCILENDCIIAAGTSLLNAYDRLEVMEYSAKSLIDTKRLNEKIYKIKEEELRDIERVFGL